MTCGFGAYAGKSMLHLVAHSFYKAHAFLIIWSVIDTIKIIQVTAPKGSVALSRIGLGILWHGSFM